MIILIYFDNPTSLFHHVKFCLIISLGLSGLSFPTCLEEIDRVEAIPNEHSEDEKIKSFNLTEKIRRK